MIEKSFELRIGSPVSERCWLKGRPSRSRLAMQLKVQQNIHFNEQIYQNYSNTNIKMKKNLYIYYKLTLDKSMMLVFYEGPVAKRKIVNSF